MSNDYQKWLREIERYLPVKNLFLLYGNIYDKLPFPIQNSQDKYDYLLLRDVIRKFFFSERIHCCRFF